MIRNLAFEFLRKHYQCDIEVENLTMKQLGNRYTQSELIQIFENGVAGLYGKVYKADVQTLVGWASEFGANQRKGSNYLFTGLLSPSITTGDSKYPSSIIEWHKEANKAYTAHCNGTDKSNFNVAIYDRLVLDGKIKLGELAKYTSKPYLEYAANPYNGVYDEADIYAAKQTAIGKYFDMCYRNGWKVIYSVSEPV